MHNRLRGAHGFTIVEVLVSVVIISILATIVTVNYTTQQTRSRDAARSSAATIIAAALEKYYDNHGEYPSPKAILGTYSANTGPVVATLLSMSDASVLVMPRAPAGTTNSLAPALGSTDVFAYVAASTVGNDNCQNNATAGCEQFTLSYKQELDGATVTINSTYHVRPDDNTSPLDAPSKPTIAATQSGTNLIATSSTPSCSTDPVMTPSYSFREQVGTGAWTAWGGWTTSGIYTRGSNTNGTTYSFQVQVRCESGTQYSDTSTPSDSASVTYYTTPTAPAIPTLTVGLSGASVLTTATAVTCNYGTVQYRIDHRTNDGTWATGTWGTGLTYSTAAADGVKYGSRVTARCVNGTQTTTGSTSTEVTYVDPIAKPTSLTVSGGGYSNPTWTWAGSACPAGTWVNYYYNWITYNTYNTTVAGGEIDANSTTSATNSAATSPGVVYTISVSQTCQSNYAESARYTAGWGPNAYIPVTHVQAQYVAYRMETGAKPSVIVKSFTGSCASGLTRLAGAKIDYANSGTYSYYTSYTDPDDGTVGSFAPVTTGTVFTNTAKAVPSYASPDTTNQTNMVEITVRVQCKNMLTKQTHDSADGVSADMVYDIGNMYNISNSKYTISCSPATKQSYCAGGYNSSGTLKSGVSSTITSCNVKATGISDSASVYSARISFGTSSACWNA